MKRREAGVLLWVLALGVAGCDGNLDLHTRWGRAVEVGAVYPLSGPQGAVGEEIRQGIDLAVAIVNDEYPDLNLPLAETRGLPGLGGTAIEVVYADHRSTEEGVREATEELISRERVAALIGAYESDKTRVASEIAENAGRPFLTATSTSQALTERGFQWFFRTSPTDTTFVTDAFQFISDLSIAQNARLERVAVIGEGTDFGRGFTELVREWAPQFGRELVAEVVAPDAADSVADEVSRVRAAEPDVVLFAVYTEDAIRFMREFKRQGYAPPLVWANDAGFISQEFQQALGADAAFVTSREVWSVDITRIHPLAAAVNALYRERYGEDLNGNSARGFIGMMTLAEAIDRAGSTEPAAVRDALRLTEIPAEQLIAPWDGIRFDETGQNILGNGIVVQLLEDRYTLVWPYEIAVEAVVFPFPAWDTR